MIQILKDNKFKFNSPTFVSGADREYLPFTTSWDPDAAKVWAGDCKETVALGSAAWGLWVEIETLWAIPTLLWDLWEHYPRSLIIHNAIHDLSNIFCNKGEMVILIGNQCEGLPHQRMERCDPLHGAKSPMLQWACGDCRFDCDAECCILGDGMSQRHTTGSRDRWSCHLGLAPIAHCRGDWGSKVGLCGNLCLQPPGPVQEEWSGLDNSLQQSSTADAQPRRQDCSQETQCYDVFWLWFDTTLHSVRHSIRYNALQNEIMWIMCRAVSDTIWVAMCTFKNIKMKALLADVYLLFFVTSARTETKLETKTEAKAEVKKNESSDENDEDADDDKVAAEEADIRDVKYRLEPLASKTWLVAAICSNQIRNQVRHDWQWTMEKYQDNIAGSTICLSKERTYPKGSQFAGEGHHMDFQSCNLIILFCSIFELNIFDILWHDVGGWLIHARHPKPVAPEASVFGKRDGYISGLAVMSKEIPKSSAFRNTKGWKTGTILEVDMLARNNMFKPEALGFWSICRPSILFPTFPKAYNLNNPVRGWSTHSETCRWHRLSLILEEPLQMYKSWSRLD